VDFADPPRADYAKPHRFLRRLFIRRSDVSKNEYTFYLDL